MPFLVGGLVVSSFAVLGDVLKPKSFAGLFSVAPSIALASLGFTVAQYGTAYAATETKSMMLAAVAFILYAWLVCRLLLRSRLPVLATTSSSLAVWPVAALALWSAALR